MPLDPTLFRACSETGYVVLENAIPELALAALDTSCQAYLEEHISFLARSCQRGRAI